MFLQKSLSKCMILLAILFFSLIPLFTFAQTTEYVLVSELGTLSGTEADPIDLTNPDPFLGNLFTIFMVVAAALAVIRLMLCGIQYMASESIGGKGEAKTCLTYVIGGLLLIFLSFLILRQINPDLAAPGLSGIRGDLVAPTIAP